MNEFTDSLPVVPVPTSEDSVILVLSRTFSHVRSISNPCATHLFQTVHDEPVSLHDRPDLRRQRPQELTRQLLFARIRHGQRGDEIDMGVGVRFVFVEPQVDHGVGCWSGNQRRVNVACALGWSRFGAGSERYSFS